jgi:hypothetical protein
MATLLRSVPTTVTVSTSALQIAASQLAAGSFAPFEQPSLSSRAAHPVSGRQCDVTEDGAGFVGHTAIDWAGKGCYDPVNRQVMWASCGAGNNSAGGYVYNTFAAYNEASNVWTASRGFQAPGESNTNPIGHMYDSNCIDVAGRRLYKKKFGAAEILVYDLDARNWTSVIPSPADEASSSRDGGMDIVPTRGARGAIWLVSWRRSDNLPQLWEYDIAAQRWSILVSGGAFGAPTGNVAVVSYNRRAFGGVGAVLVGNGAGTWTVRADTLAIGSTASPPRPLTLPHDGHLSRDPSGSGWLLAASDGYLYGTDGSAWTRRSRLPGTLGNPGHQQPVVVTPLDQYGVIWIVTSQGSGGRAWIYKA